MYKNKLTKLLSTFSSADIKKLQVFITSPYFNKNERIVVLLKEVSKYAPLFNHSSCTNEKVYAKVFPKTAFNNTRLIKLTSLLFKLAKQFIQHERLNNSPEQQELYLLDFYTKNNLDSFFTSAAAKFQQTFIDDKIQDNDWFLYKYRLELKQAQHLYSQPKDYKTDINLQAVSDALDNHYLITKLQHLCYLKNRERTVSVEYQYNFAPEIEQFLEHNSNTPFIISLWVKIYQLLCSPDSIQLYSELKTLFQTEEQSLSVINKREIYAYLENTAKFVFPTKEAHFLELFDLYESQLNEAPDYLQFFLQNTTFRNIVKVGLYLNKLDWIEQFLQKNKHYFFHQNKTEESIFNICLAMLYFEKQQYEQALDAINTTKFKSIYLKLEVRSMLIKIYYELGYYELADDNINSFRKFLSENRTYIADLYLDAYRNFINLTHSIYSTIKKDLKRINQLQDKANKIELLPEKTWILEKLEQLK